MIQRKQTLFLLALTALNVALLLVANTKVVFNSQQIDVTMAPIKHEVLTSSAGHLAAVAINFINLLLAFVAIFIYQKRELQLKICYAMAALWLVLLLMVAFCPFVTSHAGITSITTNPLTYMSGAVAILACLLAARFIKKDIELLRSADRIR